MKQESWRRQIGDLQAQILIKTWPGLPVLTSATAKDPVLRMQGLMRARRTRQLYDAEPLRKQVAVCLPGLVRTLSMTYLELQATFFHSFESYDVFVYTINDTNTPDAAYIEPTVIEISPSDVQLHNQTELKGEPYHYNSPGITGWLRQIYNIGECAKLIENYARRTGTQYDWVVRARADTHFDAPLPVLSSLDRSSFYCIPFDEYDGLNDKFYMGPANATLHLMKSLYADIVEFPGLLKPEIYFMHKLYDAGVAFNISTAFLPLNVKTVKSDGTEGEW